MGCPSTCTVGGGATKRAGGTRPDLGRSGLASLEARRPIGRKVKVSGAFGRCGGCRNRYKWRGAEAGEGSKAGPNIGQGGWGRWGWRRRWLGRGKPVVEGEAREIRGDLAMFGEVRLRANDVDDEFWRTVLLELYSRSRGS